MLRPSLAQPGGGLGPGQLHLALTCQDLLEVALAKDGSAGVGRVVHDEAGGLLIHQRLQVLQVDLPGLLRLAARGGKAEAVERGHSQGWVPASGAAQGLGTDRAWRPILVEGHWLARPKLWGQGGQAQAEPMWASPCFVPDEGKSPRELCCHGKLMLY